MLGELIAVLLVLVKVMRSKDTGKHGHVCFHLNSHEGIHNALCDELVAVNTAVDDKCGGGDSGVASRSREPAGEKRDFESAWDAVYINFRDAEFLQPLLKAVNSAIDDVSVPLGAHNGCTEGGSGVR